MMDEAAFGADRFGQPGKEGNHIMPRLAFDGSLVPYRTCSACRRRERDVHGWLSGAALGLRPGRRAVELGADETARPALDDDEPRLAEGEARRDAVLAGFVEGGYACGGEGSDRVALAAFGAPSIAELVDLQLARSLRDVLARHAGDATPDP